MESPGNGPGDLYTKQKGESNMILFVRFVMKYITVEVKISHPRKRR
jgi:hypothetical protein